MKKQHDPVQEQINSCLIALHALNRCIRGKKWTHLSERELVLNQEVERLKVAVDGSSVLDHDIVSQLGQFNIHLRRTQRQLFTQMSMVGSDIESLGKGLRKVALIREALES